MFVMIYCKYYKYIFTINSSIKGNFMLNFKVFDTTLNILLEEYGHLLIFFPPCLKPLTNLYFALTPYKIKPTVVYLVS